MRQSRHVRSTLGVPRDYRDLVGYLKNRRLIYGMLFAISKSLRSVEESMSDFVVSYMPAISQTLCCATAPVGTLEPVEFWSVYTE